MTAQLAHPATHGVTAPAMPPAAFPELTRDEVFMIGTRRLWLRWPRLDDAEALARIGGDPAVASKTATWPAGCSDAFARERIAKARAANASGMGFNFVVARRDAWGDAIGMMGFNASVGLEQLEASGGYHLAPEQWGKGYGSEALGAVVSMIRLLTRIRLLKASVMPDNTASSRVLEKAGFMKVGDGSMTTELRGTFDVYHYERRLNGIAAASGNPSLTLQQRL